MFYALRNVHGLGALPPEPPQVPNYVWVRYYAIDYNNQLTTCPKNPPYGCYIVNGYAWGKRRGTTSDEFVQLPAPYWPDLSLPKVVTRPSTTESPTTPPAKVYAVHDLKLTSPERPTIDAQSSPPLLHETPGVGAVVGIGLFVAIGLTLLL